MLVPHRLPRESVYLKRGKTKKMSSNPFYDSVHAAGLNGLQGLLGAPRPRQPDPLSRMGYNPSAQSLQQSMLAYQRQYPALYRQAQQQQSALEAQRSLMNLLANMGSAYQVQPARPPTEREIAVKELREFLGDDLWGFGYMEGLKRDVRDLS